MKLISAIVPNRIKHWHSVMRQKQFIRNLASIGRKRIKPSGDDVVLVFIAGGLGDYIASLPSLKSIGASTPDCVLVCPPHMCGFPQLHNEVSHLFTKVIEWDFYTHWTSTRTGWEATLNQINKYRVQKIYKLGPVTTYALELFISAFTNVPKYTFVSIYRSVFKNGFVVFDPRFGDKKYALCLKDLDPLVTYHGIQRRFLVATNIPLASYENDFCKIPPSSKLLPSLPYFCIQFNPSFDYRQPRLGILLDLVDFLLAEKGWHFVAMGSANPQLSRVLTSKYGDAFTDYLGKTSFDDYMSLINNASLVISADTSAAHLANAFHVPSLVFCTRMFGASLFPCDWGFGALHQAIVQVRTPCSYCAFIDTDCEEIAERKQCQLNNQKPICVDAYSSIEALSALRELLNNCCQ